jgi:Mor family transcriptional regulator
MAQYPEVLLDVAACLTGSLERRGILPETAAEIAHEATESLRKRWGGMDLYIPKGEELELAPKYLLIYERWKAGVDQLTLVRDTGYSRQWITQIVRAARAGRAQKVEASPLFPD